MLGFKSALTLMMLASFTLGSVNLCLNQTQQEDGDDGRCPRVVIITRYENVD